MKLPIIIDPRRFDAVIIDAHAVRADYDSSAALVNKLTDAGVATAVYSLDTTADTLAALFDVCVDGANASRLREAARQLKSVPERSVVVTTTAEAADAACIVGFAQVIGIDHEGDELIRSGADVVVHGLFQMEVRTGDQRMSLRTNALDAYGQLVGIVSDRQPFVCLDFDGTLSEIVADPDAATLVDGAADALKHMAAQCPVAVVSGRNVADLQARVGVPALYYVGSDGLEMIAPDGSQYQNESATVTAEVLADAADDLRRDLDGVPGAHVEHKRFAVTVHYRNVDSDHVGEVMAAAHTVSRRHGLGLTTGRKMVELRSNIDWHKGKVLQWIHDRIPPTPRMLPIYVGDDLADEDAFDVLRFHGVGIAVQSEEGGDRPTAASFSLKNPREVCEFVRRGANWLAYQRESARIAWSYTFEGYDPPTEKLREALCTVGNGYFATRGAAPESKAGQVHYPGTYAAGVYNRLDDVVSGHHTDHESLVNLPNWLALTFRIDGGDWFDVDSVELQSYRQTLDLRQAVLIRELRFRDHDGRTTSVTQRRLVGMHVAHVAALETTIVAEDWSGTIDIRSTIDGQVRNNNVERYRDLASNHLHGMKKAEIAENSVLMSVQTTQSKIPIALAARTTVWHGDSPAAATYRFVDDEFEVGHEIFGRLATGQVLTVEKVVTLVTGRDVATSEAAVGAERRLGRQGRFEEILGAHKLAWAHLWERLNLEFDDHEEELRILRLHMLHLLQTVSYHSDDIDVGVPARGLHGEAYRGHIFWDELFIFPVLNLRLPVVTRTLLQYRYRRLLEARRAATLAGYRGAMYPWQSGSDGREESPALHLNPRSGRWRPDPSHLAHHIGIAVAYNAWQFYQVTGDLAYLIDYGTEMLIEIARFWVSRTTYDAEQDRYHIKGVIGPDEFHAGYPDRPYDGVDNNAYTNVMAVWVILRAMDALALMPLPNRLDLRERLGLTDDELAEWELVGRRMFVPFHDGVISQFEGYDKLQDLDWDGYRQKYSNIQRLDRILEAENDDVNRYKASKQADALMLLYLLSSDELRELLTRLGYNFGHSQIPRMVDYYMERTSHGSTLSGVVHTWVLARANRDRAMEFFRQVLQSDVADIQGGTTSEGIHLAAMAGSIDLVQRCFTGLETRSDRIVLSPKWPESLGPFGFPIHYRGNRLHLRFGAEGAEISVDPREVPAVTVEHRGRVVRLEPGSIIRFPQ
ncbi:MAG: trehalose-phosphatase [Candidatus Sericytochromatia bacterium]